MIYSINEGQQAEEYKARKAKDAEDRDSKELERNNRRYSKPVGLEEKEKDGKKVVSSTNARRAQKAQSHLTNEFRRRYKSFADELKVASEKKLTPEERDHLLKTTRNLGNISRASGIKFDDNFKPHSTGKQGIYKATDPINRHMRRHPDRYTECSIFSNIAFI